MMRSKKVIALIIFLLLGMSQQGRTEEKSTSRVICEPVGRVLGKGFLRLKVGGLLCKGENIQVVNATKAELLCFANGQLVTVTERLPDANDCGLPNSEKSGCESAVRHGCTDLSIMNRPKIVVPYGSVSTSGRPPLSWHMVKGATSYVVEVKNKKFYWEKTVKGNTLSYPSEYPALQVASAYKVSVVAMRGESPISSSSSVINILPENKAKQIIEAVERIKSLKLPKDEEAYLDLDSIYMSESLLNSTINTLEARVKAGSQNPTLYRVLGERYLQAGYLNYAAPKFEMAAKLAATASNSVELQKARSGLELVKQYRASIVHK